MLFIDWTSRGCFNKPDLIRSKAVRLGVWVPPALEPAVIREEEQTVTWNHSWNKSYSWMIVTLHLLSPPLLPIIHSGHSVPPPSLLPSTSVFIFCLPTPTWTNTHIHSNTNTSAKLRIWARTLSCMPAGCCLHSHMTLKPGLRRRGISMNQTSCSQRPLVGSSGAQVTVRQGADALCRGSVLWPRRRTNWQSSESPSLLRGQQQSHISGPHSLLFQKNLTDLIYSPRLFKGDVNLHALACVSLLQRECMHAVIMSVTREGISHQFLSNLRIRPSFHVILLMSPRSFTRV